MRPRFALAGAWLALLAGGLSAQQSTITAITTAPGTVVVGGASTRTATSGSTSYTLNYNGMEERLTTLSVGSQAYAPSATDFGTRRVFVQRNNNGGTASTDINTDYNQTLGWNQVVSGGGTTTHTLAGVYSKDAATLLTQNNIRSGLENTFLNTESGGASNNIERVDYTFDKGITAATGQAFAVLERGGGGLNGNGNNGAFKIAAVTAVDANGNVTGIGNKQVSVAANSYGSGALASGVSYDVLAGDTGSDLGRLNNNNIGPQPVGGVLIQVSDLLDSGVTKIYGYVIFGDDVTATTGANLLNVNNTTYFPNRTSTSDMDFVSTGVQLFVPVPEPATVLGVAAAALGAGHLVRRRLARVGNPGKECR